MDRRMILALALSGLVILVFNTLVSPPPPPPPADPEPAATATGETAPRETAPSLSPPEPRPVGTPAATPTGLSRADREATVEVATRLAKGTFTNRGARITRWDLLEFTAPDGAFVRIPQVSAAEVGLLVETPTGPVSLDEVLFSLTGDETLNDGSRRLVFDAGQPGGLRVRKTFTIPPDSYRVELSVEIDGAGDASGYRVTWNRGIPPAEKNKKQYENSAGTIAFLGNGKETLKPGKFKNEKARVIEGNVKWAGVRNKYFAALLVPPRDTSTRIVATGDAEAKQTGVEMAMPLLRGSARHEIGVYLGPLDFDELKTYSQEMEQAVDLGWKVFRPISQLLLMTMKWMYGFIPNYGWVIIILSVATKVLFYPLTRTSVRSMRAMQHLQPQVTALREKYKSDPQRMQKEMMALYKEHKVNPMGGCLPILVQMPVFIGLYQVLANSITMRSAEFMGWINDLSTPETIATIGGFPIHVLPLVMTVATFFQQKLTPVQDPRQKMMGYLMPGVLLFIFYSFPAGLNLYWTVNNLLQVAQQWWIHREAPTGAPAASAATS